MWETYCVTMESTDLMDQVLVDLAIYFVGIWLYLLYHIAVVLPFIEMYLQVDFDYGICP